MSGPDVVRGLALTQQFKGTRVGVEFGSPLQAMHWHTCLQALFPTEVQQVPACGVYT